MTSAELEPRQTTPRESQSESHRQRRNVVIIFAVVLVLFLGPLLAFIFAERWAVARQGSDLALMLSVMFLPLVAILALLIFAFGVLSLPFALFSRSRRPLTFGVLVGSLAFLVGTIAGIRIGGRIRHNGFVQLAQRSTPLVQAIREYEDKNRRPPERLDDLTPGYIPVVPSTDMAAYPNYEYMCGEEAERFDGNPWVLLVRTPSGPINWDMFMYFPLQNYPEAGYGGRIEDVGDWAYVHE